MSRDWQPKVSLVVVCRNEEKTIRAAVESLLGQDYPSELVEILVVDGMSSDRTRSEISRVCPDRPGAVVRLLDNPGLTAPLGLNIGVKAASGEVIFIMGAHSRYSANYVSGAVRALAEYDADAVGGLVRALPGSSSLRARAIACALSSGFGVGNSIMRLGSIQAREVDTVAYAGYRRSVFVRFGLFNPQLVRNQDIEFNLRLRRAGRKILLLPEIQSYYYCRPTLSGLVRNAFDNGYWVVHGARVSCRPFALRHLVPLGFVSTVILAGIGALFVPGIGFALAVLAGAYLAADLVASFAVPEVPVRVRLWLPVVYLLLHFSYGLGSLWAGLRWLVDLSQRGRKRQVRPQSLHSHPLPSMEMGDWVGPESWDTKARVPCLGEQAQ